MEALISARDEAGAGLTDAQLLGNVLTVLLAGEDTTANTLGWTLYLLHSHRGQWDSLVAQVDAALAAGEDMPRQFDTARGLERIEDCVNEAMRLKPVAPLLLFEACRDTVVEGMAMPRGTQLICLMRPGAVDTAVAGDAGQYRPQRWRVAGPDHELTKASMPFGAGPRLCPGRYLAMLEMKMVLATLARNYELIEVGTADGHEPPERLAFTMFPVGLKLRVGMRH